MVTVNEPDVTVTDVEKIKTKTYGNAGKIALIGAFPTSTFNIGSFTRLVDAQKDLKGSGEVPAACVSYGCLDYIFNQDNQSKGAEEVIIVNTNYGAETLSYTIDNGKLATALTTLADEDFDILTIADAILLGTSSTLNPMWGTLHTFVDSQYTHQKPFGIITAMDIDATNTNGKALVDAFVALFHERGIYKAVSTPAHVKGDAEPLSLAQSGCWHAAFTAGRAVNKSETGKIYKNLQGQDSKSLFPISETAGVVDWEKLVDAGIHTTKYHNRRLQVVKCINNMTPVGWDMKVERVKNYIVKQLSFSDVFGEDNNEPTLDYVKGLFEYEKELALKNNYVTDMTYEITHCASDCVRAKLFLQIPEVVRHVKLEVSVEITPYEEE